MTGRTHDLVAFTGLTLTAVYYPVPTMTLATAVAVFGANFLGALFPDLDNATADFWEHLRGGELLGKIIPPLLGGHRYLTHSLLGLFLVGWLLPILLNLLGRIILVDMHLVWWGFMLGYVSHLLADTLTKEGVMWLFPLPWKIGFPPLKQLRFKTGGVIEKAVIFPGLIFTNLYLIAVNYQALLAIARSWLSQPY